MRAFQDVLIIIFNDSVSDWAVRFNCKQSLWMKLIVPWEDTEHQKWKLKSFQISKHGNFFILTFPNIQLKWKIYVFFQLSATSKMGGSIILSRTQKTIFS